MYILDDAKVFVDTVDGQTAALLIESGRYYTFNSVSSAVIADLAAGYAPADLQPELQRLAGGPLPDGALENFIRLAVEAGVLEELPGEASGERPAMQLKELPPQGEGFLLAMDSYDDMAPYFQVDPIHEVDPQKGWPYVKEDDPV